MSFWRELFAKRQPPAPKSETTFNRSMSSSPTRTDLNKHEAFLEGVCVVLGKPANELDINASLVDVYGCADLDVSECVQVAEETWRVQLMPNPMTAQDYEYMMRRLPTLKAIIDDAERRARSQP